MPQQGFDRKGKVGMFYSLICLGKYEENDYNTDSQLCLSRRTKIGARSFSSSLVTDVCLSMLLGRLFLCRWLCSCHVWYCSSQLRYKCHFFFLKKESIQQLLQSDYSMIQDKSSQNEFTCWWFWICSFFQGNLIWFDDLMVWCLLERCWRIKRHIIWRCWLAETFLSLHDTLLHCQPYVSLSISLLNIVLRLIVFFIYCMSWVKLPWWFGTLLVSGYIFQGWS